MSRETMFWIWLASTAAIVIVPMILGALLVRKFNRDQEKDGGRDKPA